MLNYQRVYRVTWQISPPWPCPELSHRQFWPATGVTSRLPGTNKKTDGKPNIFFADCFHVLVKLMCFIFSNTSSTQTTKKWLDPHVSWLNHSKCPSSIGQSTVNPGKFLAAPSHGSASVGTSNGALLGRRASCCFALRLGCVTGMVA